MTDLPTTRRPSRIPGVEAFRRGRELMQDDTGAAPFADEVGASAVPTTPAPAVHPAGTHDRPKISYERSPGAGKPSTSASASLGPTFSDGVVLRKPDKPVVERLPAGDVEELPVWAVRAFTATVLIALVGLLLTKSPVLL